MPNKTYIVSAIVSVYNCERFIAGCLEDLERQTIADKLEIVVVNSGSQQNEDAIIKEFQKKYDNIVYLKTENRETLYKAWNMGIKASSGKYITNANADDRHRKDALEILADALEEDKNISLAYYDFIVTETENETFENCTPVEYQDFPEFDKNRLLLQGPFCGHQPMWRKALHNTFGYFDDTLEVTGDYEFWLRLSEKCNFKHIKEHLGLYFKSPNSLERRDSLTIVSERVRIRSKLLKNKKVYDKKTIAALKKRQSDVIFYIGYVYMKNKQLSLARKSFLRSFVYNFHSFNSLKMFLVCLLPFEVIENLRKIKRKIAYVYAKS